MLGIIAKFDHVIMTVIAAHEVRLGSACIRRICSRASGIGGYPNGLRGAEQAKDIYARTTCSGGSAPKCDSCPLRRRGKRGPAVLAPGLFPFTVQDRDELPNKMLAAFAAAFGATTFGIAFPFRCGAFGTL
jgi:hypothetical protein